ncbi:MAG: NAD(P)-dependent oxidoreductase [Acidobacteria bacterium]|nr:MAG: NAD(P)-dependent oxidoreductase [Acidobacteriota bacterium]
MRVLVTGGAGYVGSILVERLLRDGHEVTVVDALVHGVPSLAHVASDPRFEFVYGDARDERVVLPLARRADAILPLAAVVGAPACDADPWRARTVNVDAIRMLAERTSREQLIVYPTTNSGYGTKSGEVFCTEETPLEPISLYGRTKVQAERILLDRGGAITLRLATVFGMSPRMRLDLLVNHFVWTAITEGAIVIFEKDFKRNYVHVRDVADCFAFALEHGEEMAGRPYNVGLDDANCSKAELAEKIRAHVPGFYVHFAEYGTDPDRRNYIVSNERLRQAGFEARRSLDDGIRELVKGLRMLAAAPHRNAPPVQAQRFGRPQLEPAAV